ncbi:MAG: hypothetical protein N2049_00730 [Anaerolineales bacterium]|nr:hypothetical protein [Anaerolineales bacterium]MCX7607729.1 hypothetical protein [Anaerolineales bacterium]MDW8227414.1 hypothetical protein [Anaerolineales bacterium]
MNCSTSPPDDLRRIVESARRLGIELDEAEALQWLTALAVSQGEEVVIDDRVGVFGHRITMLDFSPTDLEHFRRIGRLVEFKDIPGKVETALALSGSSAQSKIQTYPGDADYFERINILAATREEACFILADLMRQKILDTLHGPTYQFIEVKFGSYPQEVIKSGRRCPKGSPISWTAEEVCAGKIEALTPSGQPVVITWEQVSANPGWCKLDWVVADPVRGQLASASNMLDVTWQAPDGTITPLDGYLDPYFQEVYLEAESVPIFAKLAQHVSANALDEYVEQLTNEVRKYLTKDINYGKAAKRMYNIFRLTGRYQEAAFLRELFDEPASMLYQVWSLIRTLDDCCQAGTSIDMESVRQQADELILAVIRVLEGDQEAAVVRHLLKLRRTLDQAQTGTGLNAEAEAARAELINIINNFFYEKLTAVPTIRNYMEELQRTTP